MKLNALFVMAACIVPAASAWAGQSTPVEQPMLSVGLYSLRSDGSPGGSATSTGSFVGEDLAGVVYLAPCGTMGASTGAGARIPAAATDAWRLQGRVLSISDLAASAEVTWKRVREAGRDVDGPSQSRTFDLRPGDRTRLDLVKHTAAGRCPERSSALDVSFGMTRRLGAGGVAFVGGAGGGGATFVGAGAGGVANVGGAAGGVANVGPAGLAGPRPVPFVDLWLVHAAPGQEDATQHLRTVVASFARSSSFQQVRVQSPSGTFAVDVECVIEDGLSPEGEPRLFVSATRKVTYTSTTGTIRDVRPVFEGSIRTAVPRPGADQVLSFELPPIEVPGAPSVPDKLSIRLRLAHQ